MLTKDPYAKINMSYETNMTPRHCQKKKYRIK